ncbi:hypothetical protein Bca52824_001712 [Brassica carinata]|uniref:Auxin response factor domain-containing protein n=1 Tax=Brassica carinata TaxID=52824 RepID=A0A8X8BDB7_BRACI|nr:hypothetical protein Bca52824_001712 [Brassica carinata]
MATIDGTNNYMNDLLYSLMVEPNTDEIYAEVSLLPDTSDIGIPIPKNENNIQNINYFTKVLSVSDTHRNGGFVLFKRHAIECLPPLVHQKYIFSHLVGMSLQKEKNWLLETLLYSFEERMGNRGLESVKQLISANINAIKNKCMFVVIYKPRSSQFLVNYDKFVDGVNKKFRIGSRFSMKFEGKDLNEIRYNGRVVAVRDFSTHWKDSEWRSLEVQWDGAATIPRPDKVSPWEIELLTHSSNILKSDDLKHKRQIEIHEFGSKMWPPTVSQGQEIGNSSIQSTMRYSFPTISKPNNNEQMVQTMKETSTTTATTSCRLFGVDLTVLAATKDPMEPIDSYKKFKISKTFEEEKVDHVQARIRTKV